MKKKITLFTLLLLSMITYIVFMFYMSEPKYINNPDKTAYYDIEKYDIVSVRPYQGIAYDLKIGMVIQVDTTSFKNSDYAVVKSMQWNNVYNDIKINTDTPGFKIIGKGTFYHKVNHFIGFNIVMITTAFVMIFCVIIFVVLIRLIHDFGKWKIW